MPFLVLYLGYTVKCLSRCPDSAANDVLPVAAEEWELQSRINQYKQTYIVSAISAEKSCKETTYLPDPPDDHCPGLGVLLQRLMLKKHVVPGVLNPELIIPEEIPDDLWRRVFKDSAAAVLRWAILGRNKPHNSVLESYTHSYILMKCQTHNSSTQVEISKKHRN